MIRRDYFLRLVAEMAQVLARVLSLKGRKEYDEALREVDRALRELRDVNADPAGEMSLEQWIALCRKHEQAASGLMVTVADLLKEQGDVLALQNRPADSQRPRALALGLFLEALLVCETFVSAELLGKVDDLLDSTRERTIESGVRRRLVSYFVARGRFARAEDALFAWLESGDATAKTEGMAFYKQLLVLSDAELERGDLPRAEVEQGRREFIEAAALAARRDSN